MQEQTLLSIGQVLDRGFTLYRRSIGRLLPLMGVIALVLLVPRLVFPPRTLISNGHFSGNIGGYFGLILVMSVINIMFTVALMRKLDDINSGRNQLSLTEAVGVGLRRFLPMLGAGLVYGVLVMIGSILLIVPGIYLSISLIMMGYAVAVDDASIGNSITLSRDLVRGHWWRVWAIVTVVMLIYFAVYFAIAAMAGMLMPLGNVASAVSGQAAPNTIVELLLGIVLAGLNALLMPLLYAVCLVTYRDLQLRKGGGDLAARIAATA
jgi:hypothetical protein